MADDFAARYAGLLTGSYDCVDRIVLNAYYPLGSSSGGFRTWWRRMIGGSDAEADAVLDNTHLMRLAGRFARRVRAWAAGNAAAYRSGLAGLDWYRGGEYVITDQAGTPVHPEWYSDEFRRLLRRAGLRRITLHDSRHTTLTLMVSTRACRSRSSVSGRVTMTRRSRRRPTSTRARRTCNGGRPRSPGFTRSLRAVRNCETPGPKARVQGLDDRRG